MEPRDRLAAGRSEREGELGAKTPFVFVENHPVPTRVRSLVAYDIVFLPREFRDLGGEDRDLRVLGNLVRLGYGVYRHAVVSRL
jgi:hypothetical protein